MRKIRFRAWDKSTQKMIHLDPQIRLKSSDKDWQVVFGINFHSDYEDRNLMEDTFELMQFTGLKDKNGKEIYEGDIIEDQDYRARQSPWPRYFVDFDYGFFILRPVEDKTQWTEISCCKNVFVYEVIGNIYENPELLKEKK